MPRMRLAEQARCNRFQSAPGRLAGRCARSRMRAAPARDVSIRARPIGRAMRAVAAPVPRVSGVFQSAPGRLAGRCRGQQYARWLHMTSFNPRPADWPGDAASSGCLAIARPRFNPRPADWPGDATQAACAVHCSLVSIRARPIGRAMRGLVTAPRPDRWMFQSAPGRLAGRCARWQPSAASAAVVSIRARPIGRAMRAAASAQSRRLACFNPRPADWPGDAVYGRDVPASHRQFQSAPGRLAGRCLMR